MRIGWPTAALALLLPWLAGAAIDEELLEPDQAFQLKVDATPSGDVLAAWDIAPGYYLYRDKLRFESSSPAVTLGQPDLPAGKVKHDEFFGDMETYRGRLSVTVPVHNADHAPTLDLTVTYQGCADLGVCYPPQTKKVSLRLPAAAPSSPSAGSLAPLRDLGAALGLGGAAQEFLEPDQAYQFSAEVRDPQTIVARWEIAQGYYLYRERLGFDLEDAEQVKLGTPELPAGEDKDDEFLGRTQVYHHLLEVRLPVIRQTDAAVPVTLEVRYQGCAEAGLCYPPMTKTASLTLPTAAPAGVNQTVAVQGQPEPSLPPAAEQDRIAQTLASGGTLLVLGSFFVFGLLLAFTPCVFPMIPILSSIIAGQGSDISAKRAFGLSAVYVLAMAVTYTIAGVVAGLFGENLQATFQNPWILGAFSLLFVLLALSMFGFYELQLPSGWQSRLAGLSNRQHGGTLLGVAIMGFLSALIVGPCVAPPLAGALIYIGHTGDALLGGSALFAMSLGMGAPLLVVGTSAGKLLPKAGPWMDALKAAFGVLLLALAIWMLERIVPGPLVLLMWAALLIVSAVYLGALDAVPAASGWRKLWKGIGVLLLIYGALLLFGAASGGSDPWQPLRTFNLAMTSGEAESHADFQRIKTVEDLRRELALAQGQGQPVMLDFYADWCVECKRMEKYTFSDPQVQSALGQARLLQADVTANDDDDKRLLREFNLIGPPAILFFGPDGEERRNQRLIGYLAPDEFQSLVREAFG